MLSVVFGINSRKVLSGEGAKIHQTLENMLKSIVCVFCFLLCCQLHMSNSSPWIYCAAPVSTVYGNGFIMCLKRDFDLNSKQYWAFDSHVFSVNIGTSVFLINK